MTKPSGDPPRRLGRGLEALIGTATRPSTKAASTSPADTVRRIPITQIHASSFQPRTEFATADLQELKESLSTTGLLQPITVRPSPRGFEVIAGERRLRAATDLGWADIPALVKDVDDKTALTIALIENLQRADLNPLDEAQGYVRLMREFGMTQQHVAQAVGKSRPVIANALRILSLPEPVQQMLRNQEITLGHARALLSLPVDQIQDAARRVTHQKLTVRALEQISKDTKPTSRRHKKRTNGKLGRYIDANIRAIEDTLRKHLQTDVRVSLTGSDRGQLSILFYSNEDLERLLEHHALGAAPSVTGLIEEGCLVSAVKDHTQNPGLPPPKTPQKTRTKERKKELNKEPVTKPQGYGNIYTPHAGSMIIQVQRESGLQNRTIVLSPRQVQLLRFFTSRSGKIVAVILGVILALIAVEAARVPSLEHQLRAAAHTTAQLDSLERLLDKTQKNYEQVQRMLAPSENSH